ncbi:MAG TPA: FemAB family XrtA/PEP-CTERM system-associated protein [Phycisphaerae bacterium]|nr:FemAB family XrtA/PEP-CTERM system-associated protein [Phycisphaerae bacterium]
MPERALKIHELDARGQGDWQAYVDRHPEGTFFHGLIWKRAVERTFGHRSWYLFGEQAGRVVGILPLFEINSLVAGRFLVSVPYATYGGLLTDRQDVTDALFNKARTIAGQVRAQSIELRSVKAALASVEVLHTHATYRKELPLREEGVLSDLPRKARAAARRATERFELSVEFDRGLLPVVWRLYARSMRRLGSVNYPYQFFEELVQASGQQNVVQVVRHGGRPVAGLLTFLYRDTVLPYFSGLDEREPIYGLNNYLYLESMRWGVRHGYRQYDFGRTRLDNAGCSDFKRFCGFTPQELQYQNYVMPGRRAPDLSPSSPRWAAARRLWRVLPLPITRPVGGWLAKSIPG